MIQPVVKQGIPIRVFNSHAPERSGTLICHQTSGSAGSVKAIAHKPKVTAIEITSAPTFVANGFLRAIERAFHRQQLAFEIIGASDIGVSIACRDQELAPSLARDLDQLGSVEIERGRSIVACIGSGLRGPGGSGPCIDQLKNIDPTLKWQSSSLVNLVTTVAADSEGRTIKALHCALFESQPMRGD
jgi:aspartokinase